MNTCPRGAVATADAPFAALAAAQREFFANGATLPYSFRTSALEALLDAVTAGVQESLPIFYSAPKIHQAYPKYTM